MSLCQGPTLPAWIPDWQIYLFLPSELTRAIRYGLAGIMHLSLLVSVKSWGKYSFWCNRSATYNHLGFSTGSFSPVPFPHAWSQPGMYTLALFFTCSPGTTSFVNLWPGCWKYRFGSLSQTFRISWDGSWELLSHSLLVVVREGPLESFPSSVVRKSCESPWAPAVCWCWELHGKSSALSVWAWLSVWRWAPAHGTCSKWACMSIYTH